MSLTDQASAELVKSTSKHPTLVTPVQVDVSKDSDVAS